MHGSQIKAVGQRLKQVYTAVVEQRQTKMCIACFSALDEKLACMRRNSAQAVKDLHMQEKPAVFCDSQNKPCCQPYAATLH